MENALSVMIMLSAVAIFFIVKNAILFKRLKDSQERQNYFIGVILREGVVEYGYTNSLLSRLTVLKEQYCSENHGEESMFLFDAGMCIEHVIKAQTDGKALFDILTGNNTVLDPEIENRVKDACRATEEKLVEIFEHTYKANNKYEGDTKGRNYFIKMLHDPYFEKSKLRAYFFHLVEQGSQKAMA